MGNCGSAKTAELNIVDVCRGFQGNTFKNVVVMIGCGASISASFPDVQIQSDGFVGLLERDFKVGSLAMTTETFVRDPRAFYVLLGSVFKNRVLGAEVDTVQKFLRVLEGKGILRRVYTACVAGLERRAGIVSDKLVEVNGSFRTSLCLQCGRKFDWNWFKGFMESGNFDPGKGAISVPFCPECKGIIKPDIALTGDPTNERFKRLVQCRCQYM